MKKRLAVTFTVGLCLTVATVWYSLPEEVEVYQPTISEVKTNVSVSKHSDNPEDLNYNIVDTTKKLSEEFVFYMASLDPKDPNAHLSKVRPITNDDLFMELDTTLRRPTEVSNKRVVTEVLAYPIDDILPNRKKWNVIAVCDVYDADGNKHTEEISYWVSIAMNNQKEWKITGFKVGEL